MSQAIADSIREYIRAGGMLVAEGRPASQDERGRPAGRIPGAGLDEVFGARETALRRGESVSMTIVPDAAPELRGFENRQISAAGVLGLLRVDGARVLARADTGEPVAAINSFGEGRAVLIGSLPAAAFAQDPQRHAPAGELIAALATMARVEPRVKVSGAPAGAVEARLMESGRAMLLVVLNHDAAPHRLQLELPPDAPAGEWQNLETAAAIPLAGRAGGGPAFQHDLGGRDVLVLLARKPPA
jgi:hypothetical protein